jgi:hypothetical protein
LSKHNFRPILQLMSLRRTQSLYIVRLRLYAFCQGSNYGVRLIPLVDPAEEDEGELVAELLEELLPAPVVPPPRPAVAPPSAVPEFPVVVLLEVLDGEMAVPVPCWPMAVPLPC